MCVKEVDEETAVDNRETPPIDIAIAVGQSFSCRTASSHLRAQL